LIVKHHTNYGDIPDIKKSRCSKLKRMRTIFLLLILALTSLYLAGQSIQKISIFAKMQGNYILYDQAMGRSPGFGTGIEFDVSLKSGLRLFLDGNCDFYPTNAVLVYVDGVEMENKKTVLSILAGMSYPVFRNFYISLEAGPTFINSDVYPGIKPGISYFLDKKQRISVALSLTNIIKADHSDDGPFGYAGLGLIFRVF
jgi:hypothetical protein